MPKPQVQPEYPESHKKLWKAVLDLEASPLQFLKDLYPEARHLSDWFGWLSGAHFVRPLQAS